ncbi:MAG: signal peptidase II [Lentisphaerae bacterium]|nr:signal peptidase II [Lentisphaerota bacterium]
MLILWVSAAIAVLDQASKYLIRDRFHVGDFIPVIPRFFDLHYVQNTGAAWGLFAGFSHWLVLVSVVMLVVLVVFRRSIMTDSLIHRCATALMIGGIVGNLIDRVRLGYVVDFLDFYWIERGGPHHFPAFNVADSAICIGVGLYILTQVWPQPVGAETLADHPTPATDS